MMRLVPPRISEVNRWNDYMKCTLSTLGMLLLATFARSAPPPITALSYHPGGKLLAAGTYDEVILIDPAKGEVVDKLDGQLNRVTALGFTKAGDRLAVASGEPSKLGIIRIYEVDGSGAKPRAALAEAHKYIIYALVFSPDGKLL